jgi:hypothetical protein
VPSTFGRVGPGPCKRCGLRATVAESTRGKKEDMKTRLLGLFVVTVFASCTSSTPPRHTSGSAGGGGSAGSVGTAGGSGTVGTAGTSGSAGASGDAGASGSAGASGVAGASGSAGAGVAGATGTAGAAGAGTAGAAGGTAGAGTAGAAGSATDGGTKMDASSGTDGPNQVPAVYTGKPLGGTPQAIPGMIQIESYDTGGSGVAYKASGTGHGSLCGVTRTDLIDLNCTGQAGSPTDQTQGTCAKLTNDVYLGYIATGDWLNYTVNVTEAGTYAISSHAGVAGTTKLMFTFTPTVKTAALTLPGTSGCNVESYHVWAVQNLGTIALEPGTYVMRLDFVAAGLNIDWVAFTKM